ncbi:hypothetical protein [Absidia glauca]|uniref:MARVEL domain-containing protein n=1 Tax=Absidia glauca TaxID=4829 RepID=A0A168P9W6_ABSGL|nr:hypothetical protein [Absidia glauca]
MKNQRSKPGPVKKEKRPPSDRPLKKPGEGKTSATSLSSTKSSDSESSLKEEEQMPSPPPYHPPSMARLLVRFWQSLAALGALGFQIGASPYSGIPSVFRDLKLQYYTYSVDVLSLLWAMFMIYVYLTRRFGGNTGKVKRPIAFAMDTSLAILFGVATFYQFASYNCPPGRYNGWCDFHNTGRFFLLSLFLTYSIMMCWDLFGGCSCLRT